MGLAWSAEGSGVVTAAPPTPIRSADLSALPSKPPAHSPAAAAAAAALLAPPTAAAATATATAAADPAPNSKLPPAPAPRPPPPPPARAGDNADVTFLMAPEFPADAATAESPSRPAADPDLDRILHANAADLTEPELRLRLAAVERRDAQHAAAIRDFVHALALGPDMSKWYSDLLRDLLRRVLSNMDLVDSVEYIECSFPSVPREAPDLSLVLWRGLSYSEWDVSWSPRSWWIAASILGKQLAAPLPAAFSVVATVSGFRATARVRVALSRDCSALRVAFAGQPVVELGVGTRGGIGSIPVPIQDRIEAALGAEIGRFIERNLMGGASMVVPLRRRVRKQLSEDDVRAAEDAAKRAVVFRRRTAGAAATAAATTAPPR